MKKTGTYELDMTTGALLPKMLRFALPLMLSSLLQLLFNAADIAVFLGKHIDRFQIHFAGFLQMHSATSFFYKIT